MSRFNKSGMKQMLVSGVIVMIIITMFGDLEQPVEIERRVEIVEDYDEYGLSLGQIIIGYEMEKVAYGETIIMMKQKIESSPDGEFTFYPSPTPVKIDSVYQWGKIDTLAYYDRYTGKLFIVDNMKFEKYIELGSVTSH